jgi:hypothetical protein
MAVPVVKPGSITAIKEVGKVEAVVVTVLGMKEPIGLLSLGRRFLYC